MDAEATAPARESDLIALAADIVSAFVSNNSVATGDLPNLINDVHSALKRLGAPPAPERDKPEPAVPIKKSVTPDYIISLFDGRKYKSLKRHIRTAHDMTPQQYREFWKLAPDYPGGAELCQGPFGIGPQHGPRPESGRSEEKRQARQEGSLGWPKLKHRRGPEPTRTSACTVRSWIWLRSGSPVAVPTPPTLSS